MNAYNLLLISAFIYLIALVSFSSTQCVPVYLWHNSELNGNVPALQRASKESFVENYKNQFDKKAPIIVFAEQSLSTEDFLLRNDKGQSIFTTLSPLIESYTVNYWPCVKNPVEGIAELKGKNVVQISFSDFSFESFQLKPSDVLVIDLNDAKEDENRINMLQRHDENIGKIYEHYQKQYKDITMVFTGYQPSWITVDEVRSHRRIRDTSKADGAIPKEDAYVVYQNEDIIISALDSPILYHNDTIVPLRDANITTEGKTTDGLNISMVLNDITIMWQFHTGGGYWTLKNLTVVNASASGQDSEYYFRVKDIYAPYRFSYHCTNTSFQYPKNNRQYVTFSDLQLQVFFGGLVQASKFGDAFDCTGFITTPIWSGLFVTFILVLIMTCGLTMMMDIKTMDRFDDPKGKTITINASE